MKTISLDKVVWDPAIYPRKKWSTTTIERYRDALDAGANMPDIILEKGTDRLLDGKQRYEAHKLADRKTINAEWHTVPRGMTAKYYAAQLSSRHGDRMTNADLKALAEEEFQADYELPPEERRNLDAQTWGQALGVSKSTVYNWVGHIINRDKASRATKAWRLAMLGWTQREIGERLGVDNSLISKTLKDSNIGKIQDIIGDNWNAQAVAETARRMDWPLTDSWAAAMVGLDDTDRLAKLEIKLQPYDVWHFQSCHDLMGDKHPGRIPGELLCHLLYFYTQQDDLIIDPMVGSGTTLDACLLMGRKCRGYDIDGRHERIDVEQHDIAENGWPDTVKKASLLFWDPPYFDKMDGTNQKDGYIEGSISGLDRDKYLAFFTDAFADAIEKAKKGAVLAFLMSDWNDNNGKLPGIFVWDYAGLIADAGWTLERHIQVPLSTQQVHPDIVNKYRASRKLARLERYLLIAGKQ